MTGVGGSSGAPTGSVGEAGGSFRDASYFEIWALKRSSPRVVGSLCYAGARRQRVAYQCGGAAADDPRRRLRRRRRRDPLPRLRRRRRLK